MGLFLIFYKKAKKFLLAQKDKKILADRGN